MIDSRPPACLPKWNVGMATSKLFILGPAGAGRKYPLSNTGLKLKRMIFRNYLITDHDSAVFFTFYIITFYILLLRDLKIYITPALVSRNNIVIARREERATKQSPKGCGIKEIASLLHASR